MYCGGGYGQGGCGGGYAGGSSGGSYSTSSGPSQLEYMASEAPTNSYSTSTSYTGSHASASYNPQSTGTYSQQSGEHYLMPHNEMQMAAFSADEFLDPFRPRTPFVGKAEEIAPYVEEAFERLMGSKLPHDIIVRVGTEEQLSKAFPGDWDSSIQGFALNRVGWGTSEIFARQNELDRLMLTIGHELGHVMSQSIPNPRDEEAKAFAFSLAWMKTIKDNNIAGIGHAINPMPAKNGLHDVAFGFVADMVERGKAALDVFSELVQRVITVR